MASDAAYVLHHLRDIEEMAEEILTDKGQIVQLDHKRNKTREALRALSKEMKNDSSEKKSWLCFGNMFVKLSRVKIKDILEKDQKYLNEEITNISNNLKPKVDKLNEMEGKPQIQGFNLKPLTREESTAIKSAMKI